MSPSLTVSQCPLLPSILVMVMLALLTLGCNGDEHVAAAPGQVLATTPAETSTSVPAPEVTPAPALPDRQDCGEMRGTEYRSPFEREWFLAHCLPTPSPTSHVPAPSPPPIPGNEVEGERWLLVDLKTQTISALIGEEFIYTALATTGDDGWETPVGTFHILYRVENETMTSASIGADEFYVLEDVLYTQYFTNVGQQST